MSGGRDVDGIGDSAEVEEFELAFARLDWVRAAGCLHLPAQREAVQWHIECCEAALSAVDRRSDG